MARRVFVNEVIDPADAFFYAEAGSHDSAFLNLDYTGTFYIRSSERIRVEGGQVGGTSRGENCQIGSAVGGGACRDIVVRGVTFHDMTVSDSTQHHEALFVAEVDGLILDGCRFERIFGNTADVYFTAVQNPRSAKNVVVRGCYFGRPTNGRRADAIQWGGGSGDDPHDGFLIEGNLFDGSTMNFGTLVRAVKNFTVGVNYGSTPSDNQIAYARGKGVQFLELPFRPASEWPGAVVTPPPPPDPEPDPEPDPDPEPVDPCAAVRDELAATQGMLATANGQLALLTAELANLYAGVADRQGRLDRIRAILDEA